jgi:hypothetical protein
MSEHLNELIGYNVQGTAEWRLRKAEQFPDDTRNIRAAEELEQLAREISGLNGSEVERQIDEVHDSLIREGWEDVWSELNEDVSAELRSIGFYNSYSSATKFLEWYRDLLTEKLQQKIEEVVPAPSLHDQVENDPGVKAAKQAYEEAYAQALAEARKTI